MTTAGILTVLAVLVLFIKLGKPTLRKLLGYDIYIDIAVTAGLTMLLAGTFSGMMAAISAGLLFSLSLWGIKFWIGSERLARKTCGDCRHTTWYWQEQPRSRVLTQLLDS